MLHTPLHLIADCAGPEQAAHSTAAHVSHRSWTPSHAPFNMHAMGSLHSYGALGTLHGPGLGSHGLPWLACLCVVYGQKGGNRVMKD